MTTAKQQFNVALPRELIRRIKHRSIDAQLSLSDLVTQVLDTYLSEMESKMQPEQVDGNPAEPEPAGQLRLQPMVHVQDMAAALGFFHELGGELQHGSRDGDWALIRIGGTELSLLAHPPNPDQNEGLVELNFQYAGPLDALQEQLQAAGVRIAQPVTDEGFGRQLQLSSPDGLLIKVNQLEPELYT